MFAGGVARPDYGLAVGPHADPDDAEGESLGVAQKPSALTARSNPDVD
ncbi:hypothetical protein [Micromonospora sp. WMMD1219]